MNIKDLPIYKQESIIIETFWKNRCVIITGNTGCGKSTQLPIMLYKNYDHKLNILCTQPRRVACINIANQVSKQLNTQLGKIVGYHIGTDPMVSKETKISFVTVGIFLNYLIHNPKCLKEYDVVILDEVHERDLDLDFVLLLLKILLTRLDHLKVIFMSATINSEKLAKYFSLQQIQKTKEVSNQFLHQVKVKEHCGASSKHEEHKNYGTKKEDQDVKYLDHFKVEEHTSKCPVIEIQMKMPFKIQTFYFDQLLKFKSFSNNHLKKILENKVISLKPILITDFVNISTELIVYILKRRQQKNKEDFVKFLVFMPGFNEIVFYQNQLKQKLEENQLSIEIIPIHSKLMNKENFSTLLKQQNQILVATNMAESSITIPNIRYVIDFCLTKVQKFTKNWANYLGMEWSSQSSSIQRKGRTGRCNNGYYFVMTTQHMYNKFSDQNEPEILKFPLDRLFLKINIIHEKIQNTHKDEYLDFVKKMFQSPFLIFSFCIEQINKTQLIESKNFLLSINAIERNESTGYYKNTFLGNLYSELPCELELIRLILFGKLNNCLWESVILSGILSTEKSIFVSFQKIGQEKKIEKFHHVLKEMAQGQFCDYLIYINLYKQWVRLFEVENFYEESKPLHFWLSKINQQYRQQKENQNWVQIHFVNQSSFLWVFEQIFVLRKNLDKQQPEFFIQSPEEKEFDFEWFQMTMFMAFFPNLIKLQRDNSIYSLKERGFIENYLGLNYDCCVKVENFKWSQSIKTIKNFQPDDQILKYQKHYQSLLENYLNENFYQDISKVITHDLNVFIEFKKHKAEEAIQKLFFQEKFQVKAEYSLKTYSFIEGMREQNFEQNQHQNQGQQKVQPIVKREEEEYIKKESEQENLDDKQIEKIYSLRQFQQMDKIQIIDCVQFKEIGISTQSYNSQLMLRKNQLQCFIVSHQFHEKSNKKILCEASSVMMGDYDFLELGLLLNSGPKDRIFNTGGELDSIRLCDSEHSLKTHFTRFDMKDLESIQNQINHCFTKLDYLNNPGFYEELQRFYKKNRTAYVFQEKWFGYFKSNYCQRNESHQNQEQDEILQYFHWKNKIILHLERIERISMLDKAILVCGRCGCKLLDLNGISIEGEEFHREIVQKQLWSLKHMSIQDFKTIHQKKDPAILKYFQLMSEKGFEYLSVYLCQQDHLVALGLNKKVMIPDFTQIKILLQNGDEMIFDNKTLCYQSLLVKQEKAQMEKKKLLNEFTCEICLDQQYYDSYQALLKHLASNTHKDDILAFGKNLN